MIRLVKTKSDLKKFTQLPWKIYKNDPSWCPPFLFECKKMFQGKHPFYEYGEMALFLAEKEGEVVGRIAAIKNSKHTQQYQDKAGFFGFFEAIDDQIVADALLDRAKSWLKEQGFTKMIGPASPSSNYDYGCQFSGFDQSHVILSTHNAPYYLKLFENYGLNKRIDLFAYKVTRKVVENSPVIKALDRLAHKNPRVNIRQLNKKKAREEIQLLAQIFNACWTDNHGFVPITELEASYLYSSLRPLLDSNLILFAEVDGKVVGGMILLLDYNQLFKSMNGRIFPWHLVKLFTQKKKITWLRCFITGILPEYRNKSIFPLLLYETVKRGIARKGVDFLEGSYVLENNYPMITALEKIGGEIYKKYRVFEKTL